MEKKCSDRDCEEQAASVVRTKQAKGVGSGPVTTITWFLDDASEVEQRLGSLYCAEHRDHLLTQLGKVL